MISELPRRFLAFEKLERKEFPSSTWILLAATDPQDQQWFEQAAATSSDLSSSSLSSKVDTTSSQWNGAHSTEELLHFIDEHTYPERIAGRSLATPSPAQCAAADEMMKLDDIALRDLILHSTFSVR